MSIDGRLEKFERSLNYRELAFLWLKTMQAKGGFSDYWKFGSFESWPSESEELGFLYNLVFEVNSLAPVAWNQPVNLSISAPVRVKSRSLEPIMHPNMHLLRGSPNSIDN